MVIAVWGRDGVGKSVLCDTLGILYAKQSLTAVIDTDLTQPTLPLRLDGMKPGEDTSLGKAISIGAVDAAPYLHQHPKLKTLFYAGLTNQDDYMSHEIGLEAVTTAWDFSERCVELVDTAIFDLSGQRCDPFLPGAIVYADRVIPLFTPDAQGVCWYNSVRSFLKKLDLLENIFPVAAMTDRHHDLSAVEKAVDTKFAAVLPFVREFRQDDNDGTTPSAMRYLREVKKLCALLKGVVKI